MKRRALTLVALLLAGCVLDHPLALQGPVRDTLEAQPTFTELVVQYRSGSEAKQSRNQIIRRLMLADDEYFLAYTNQLYHGRALADTASEIVTASLTTAATAVNPAAAAKVLTGVAAGLVASKVSVDKNIFMQQAASALIAKMEAQRAVVDARIHSYMLQSVEDYPLEEGLRDFIKYYRAGTLAAAAQSLTADAEQQHATASEELHETKLQASPLSGFTTPRTHVSVGRHPGITGTYRPGADKVPRMPDSFRARNDRLRDIFPHSTDQRARAALVQAALDKGKTPLPANADPTEFLAEQICAEAGLDSHHNGKSAVASLTYHRRCAVDEAKTANLEKAYRVFFTLPELPPPPVVVGPAGPAPAPSVSPAPSPGG